MRLRGIATGIVVLICLTSCTNGSDPDSSPDKAKDVATIDPTKAEDLKIGEDLEVVAELPSTIGESTTYFERFTPDGMVLGGISLPDKADSGTMGRVTTQGHPILYDPESKKTTVLDNRDRKEPTQLAGLASDANIVAWIETTDAMVGTGNFTIQAYDRRTKAVTQLAAFTDPKGSIVYGNDLVLDGDVAYFSRSAWRPQNSGKDSAIYTVPVDGSAPPKVLIKGAAFVKIDGDVMTYRAGRETLRDRDLSTGATTPARVSPDADKPGFCGAEFAKTYETLCMGTPNGEDRVADAALTIKEASGRTTVFKPFPSDSLNYAVPRDVIPVGPWMGVTMTSDEGAKREFLVDLDSKKVKVFPNGTSFGALNHDESMVLLSTPSFEKTAPPQMIVRIPPKG